jgi:hypothetical protein
MKVATLQYQINTLECELKHLKLQLGEAIRDCPHKWTTPIADHIYHKGYTIPGDPPGTMGVDWRGPVDVPSKTEKRWKRTCTVCGHVEFTSKVEQRIEEFPRF